MLKKLISQARNDWICFIGDDCIPQAGFLKNSLSAATELPDQWGMVGINDNLRLLWDKSMANVRRAPAHWIAHKNLLPLLDGEFFHTGYKHCYCDNELMQRVKAMGRYTFCESSMVFHEHVLLDKKFDDADYQRVYSNAVYVHDLVLFRRRRATGWTFIKPDENIINKSAESGTS
jgi:hypothetical protein